MIGGYHTPGVYTEELAPTEAAILRTGRPAFLGYAPAGPLNQPAPIRDYAQFAATFGPAGAGGYLAAAVRGFFENGGTVCYAVRLDDSAEADPSRALAALRAGLAAIEPLGDIDLVCVPDSVRLAQPADVRTLQAEVLAHCARLGTRFAILDSPAGASVADVIAYRQGFAASQGADGALYYPWVQPVSGPAVFVPPCGYVAGVYAATDAQVGVFKAPANIALAGVLDLERRLNDAEQGQLNPLGINCLRVFPGRGIRVWGARTLSAGDTNWTYVNVRRLFLTAARWTERSLAGVAFEPHDVRLWARISRELTAYFADLYRRGALQGGTAAEAFYVKCDADTNPPAVRAAGMIVTEIGLAATVPNEFIVVRIVHSNSGVEIGGPAE